MASVGVVIPTYNSAEFLEETVASALAQTVPVSQIVIIDDGSPDDDSYALGQRLAAEHSCITSKKQKNAGAAAARNTGFELLSTDYVIFLDADDRLFPEAVALHLEAFAARPEAVLVLGSNNVMDRSGRVILEGQIPVETVDRAKLALRVTPCPSQCMYRSDAFVKVGKFDPTLRPGDEIDLNFRLERIGEIFSHGAFVMDYREHPGQGTNNRVNIARTHLRALEKNLGPQAEHPETTLLGMARRHWLCRYGQDQFRVTLGQLRRGNWRKAFEAAHLWLDAVPAWLHRALFGPTKIP